MNEEIIKDEVMETVEDSMDTTYKVAAVESDPEIFEIEESNDKGNGALAVALVGLLGAGLTYGAVKLYKKFRKKTHEKATKSEVIDAEIIEESDNTVFVEEDPEDERVVVEKQDEQTESVKKEKR